MVPASEAQADEGGSTLVSETFKGSTVADSRWIPLGDACLTGATADASAPGSGSALAGCQKSTDTAYLLGQDGDGYLQLTDNSGSSTADVLFDRAIPSANGLDVSFYQYQFATSPTGLGNADGIGFFLTDGSYTLDQAGPTGSNFGGALGYATIEKEKGIQKGVLAVGLDVYGNFSYQPYVGTSCTATNPRTQNAVVLRGSGDGTTGYCLLASSPLSTNGPQIKTDGPTGQVDGVPGSSTDDKGTLVRIVISPKDGDQAQTVTVYLNGTQVSTSQLDQPLPATVKLGFSSSTGGGHAAHLIRTVSVKSVDSLGDINLVKSVDHTAETGTSKTEFTEGDTVPYSVLVTNTGEDPLEDVTVTDPKIRDITCPSTSLAPADSFVCTGKYTVTAEDVEAGSFPNTATATGTTPDGDKPTSDSSTSVPTYSTSTLAITKDLQGSGTSAVPDDTEYVASYSYEAGAYEYCTADGVAEPTDTTGSYPAGSGFLRVKADGTAVQSDPIPVGAVVTVGEVKPLDTDVITWDEPTITPASGQVTIGCDPTANTAGITNTVNTIPGSVSWSKVDPSGNALAGSEWELSGPGEFSETVVDNGENDEDPAVGALKVSGLSWGEYSLKETKAPEGYELATDVLGPKTISADALEVSFGEIENQPTPVKPTPTPTPSTTPSSTPSTPGKDEGGLAHTGSDARAIGGGALALLLAGGAALSIRRLVRK